jgi:hypothetical protein
MKHSHLRQVALIGVAGGAGLLAVYMRLVRPWTLRWGATDAEVGRPLPGDQLMTRPGFKATRAITIAARPEHIWPWLVQLGSGRAGWYAIDRIDNAGVPSAQTIRPELQDLQVGDRIPMIAGKDVGPVVKELEPNRRMLWWDGHGEFTWNGSSTRSTTVRPGFCAAFRSRIRRCGRGECSMPWWPAPVTS